MASKRTQPALYELMGNQDRPAATPPDPQGEPRAMGWLGAGRSIRLPVGYIWLVAGVVLVLVVGAFSFGFLRGRQDAEAVYQREWLAMNALPVPPPEIEQDPVSMSTTPTPAPKSGPAGWGPVESDPREVGRNYFVLIATHRANAVAVAEFCREHGVEAYVARGNNSSYHRVFALPGYAGGDRGSEAVTALEGRITEVARRWKLEVNPRDDLAYYPERFKG